MILVEVRGKYLTPDGKPARGTVKFSQRPTYVADQPDNQALVGPITVKLDWKGEFAVHLAAGDDSDLTPTDWTYEVVERFEGWPVRRFDVLIGSQFASGGVDLADIAPTAASGGIGGVTGPQGPDGWSPILAIESDGARRVHKLVDWVGGEGSKPAVPANPYIGASGFTNLAGAVDARGGTGAQGNDGWEPVLALESDGARRVLKLVDWVGGGGSKPSVPSPNYLGASGLTNLAGAIDVRGPQGVQGETGEAGEIADGSVTNAKLASMAQGTFKVRVSSGSGAPENATAEQAKTVLGITPADVAGFAEAAQDAAAAALTAHIDDSTAAHAASAIALTPTGDVAATTVQAGIAELASEKAPLASPALTGTPTTPTATAGTNTTQIASTAFVATAVANLIAAAPGALDTLDELAAALGDDANFAATMTTALAGKQPLDSDLTAIAALTTTSFGRALLALADAAAARTALELGTAATSASSAFQAADSDLTAIAALSPSNDDIVQRKSGAWTNRTPAQVKTDLALAKGDVGLGNVDNTSDANKPVSTATQTALDLKAPLASPALTGNPTAPTQSAGNNSTRVATTAYADAAVAAHTSDTTAAHAASAVSFDATGMAWASGDTVQLGIDALDGTIDLIFSTLSSKANLASPALTGNPTAPTQAAGTNNTRIATTAYADAGVVINAQTGTTYTLVLTDQNKRVHCTNASAITLTIPPNSSVAFPVGTVLEVAQRGAGQVTVAPGSGVTLNPATKRKTAEQYASVGLVKVATDEWDLTGGVA